MTDDTPSLRHEFAAALVQAGDAAFKLSLARPPDSVYLDIGDAERKIAMPITAVLNYYLPDYDHDLADGLVGRALDKLDDAVMLDEGTLPAIYNAHLQLAADMFNQAVVLYVNLLPAAEVA